MRPRHLALFLPFLLVCVPPRGVKADPAPAADPADLAKQLADAQDRLAIALRSYAILQDENGQLKADLAAQLGALRTQVRQLQDQVADLAAENARLKMRAALSGPAPAGGLPSPTRPATP